MAADDCDLVAVLLDEHCALERRTELVMGGGDGDAGRLVAELLTEMCQYGRVAEGHLDPLIRRYLPDGAERADAHLGEYVQMERMVAELRRHRPGDARCTELLGPLVSRLRHHLAEEEQELLPCLRRHVPAEVLRQRGVLAVRGARAPAVVR